jgi:cyclopropane-fatty-acyl-phospholipid synthase
MTADIPRRGDHLVRADRGFSTGSWRVSRWLAPAFRRVLDRVDRGLAEGAIEATLPDGRRRRLGGRAPGPVAVVTLHDWRPLMRLMLSGSVGWYRSWADGEWSSPDPVPLVELFMRNRHALGATARAHGWGRIVNRIAHAWRRNDPRGARRNSAFHYDLGNDFYAVWLDPGMTYSSAMFGWAGEPLEQAQGRKMRALLDRLGTRPGQRLLEIGCGWGSLADVAARDYGLTVTGLTLSAEQKAWADARVPDTVAIALRDYRDETGTYDAVASVEMVEAVGAAYWPTYMCAIAHALKPGGRAAIQYIAIDDAVYERYAASADFIQTYVFPGGMLISESRFRAAAAAAGLEWRDRTGFGGDYAETLRLWRVRFDDAVRAGRLPEGFDDRFVRLWRYYLMYCEGGFRGGGIDVAQVTLVKI